MPPLLPLAALALLAAAPALGQGTIRNDRFWTDTAGTPVYSQGGGILKVGTRYYWYGVKYEEAVAYARDPTTPHPNPHFAAVTVYSSDDLVTWRYEGDAIKAGAAGERFPRDAWFGRLGVAYHAATRRYVLVSQYGGKDTGPGIVFATSKSPAGPFTFARHQPVIANVSTPTSGDQTLFVDDDGKPYLVFGSGGSRRDLYVAPLRPDYLGIEPATRIYTAPGAGREGNAMFKHRGIYYFCSSDLHGWNASRSYCMHADRITGPYSPDRLLEGTAADFSHVSQNGFFIPVHGSTGTTIVYAGDRWSDFAGNGPGYNVWVPLSFDGRTPRFHSLSEWHLDAKRGTWGVGANNNYALNPGFEADRVTQTQLAGWQVSWTSIRDNSPIVNLRDGRTGRWALTLPHAAPSMATATQDVTLPDGDYTLRLWIRSSGGQKVARVFAVGHGGAEVAQTLSGRIDEWRQITLPTIPVRTGRVQIGVYSEGQDNQWLRIDDVSLTRNR
ncbi:family 43 glycosylhydrolase [Sphingomonas sp. Leaf25]|uniref:family 43 glycosylhydrolase n=1 Tax=Sphingomonas sp. Leaf25 TaxID=1735692 RepID=UPI0006F4B6B0|nr:family 43 glycosylhydrolase [Sphingomonas sp. Leaf25]KQN07656.1 beta-xylosidase [Sphingomonas sp. Leaf25]